MKAVFILKGKLYHADNIVPLAYQLYCDHVINKAVFVAPSPQDVRILKENQALTTAIEKMGTLSNLIREPRVKPDSITGRLATLRPVRWAQNLWVLRHYFFGAVVSVEIEPGRWLNMLTKLNGWVFGGRRVFLVTDNLPYPVSYALRRAAEQAYDRRFTKHFPNCFAILGSHSRAEVENLCVLKAPAETRWIEIGYTRGIECWLEHLEQVENSIDGPYVFFPLSVLQRTEPNGRVYRFHESLTSMLSILREFENEVKVVFRYHPATDRQHFGRILRQSGLVNYEISFVHPLRLIAAAKCMITYGVSSLAADAWQLGCRTIEYGQPGASLYEHVDDSTYAYVTDHFIYNDIDELRRVIRNAIESDKSAVPKVRAGSAKFEALDGKELTRRLKFVFDSRVSAR